MAHRSPYSQALLPHTAAGMLLVMPVIVAFSAGMGTFVSVSLSVDAPRNGATEATTGASFTVATHSPCDNIDSQQRSPIAAAHRIRNSR